MALKALFAAADSDGNGTLDKEEVLKACGPLERGEGAAVVAALRGAKKMD